jgi:hypothetical protein
MTRKDWPVVASDVRPARPNGTCFYCEVALGDQHDPGCVIRTRTVVVEHLIRVVREVPEHWSQKDVEFHFGDSSWCAGNLVDDLDGLPDENDVGAGPHQRTCLCDNLVRTDLIGEATEEDEQLYAVVGRRAASTPASEPPAPA